MAKRPAKPMFEEGEGSSMAQAVVIDAKDILKGTDAEYACIARHCGAHGKDWALTRQSTFRIGGRTYDQIDVRRANGVERTFYFDISRFHGRV
jgi:hypothetical protein